ncbi:hypothetical protein CYMTET_44623 [Cymbomonas tetramitiformis]|uniref:Uncharacterized protein n=1 Tax=Cymbomonas tetramitiformis TaxID=36881 RepID=A0AAE0C1W1_9CHLO|nr:hypothetical protein CYMTET_44623 [Cymbomonas tetramitiformis]
MLKDIDEPIARTERSKATVKHPARRKRLRRSNSGGVRRDTSLGDDSEEAHVEEPESSSLRVDIYVEDDCADTQIAWILQADEKDPSRIMCVVPGQAVIVRMQDGSEASALIRALDRENEDLESLGFDGSGVARITWYDESNVFEADDVVSLNCLQSEHTNHSLYDHHVWTHSVHRTIFDPSFWLDREHHTEVAAYMCWGWKRVHAKTDGYPNMPAQTRQLFDSVINVALSMGLELKANERMKRDLELCLLSPFRRLNMYCVSQEKKSHAQCGLCGVTCSRTLYGLQFRKTTFLQDTVSSVEVVAGYTCAASCVLAYECVSVLGRMYDYVSCDRDHRFCRTCMKIPKDERGAPSVQRHLDVYTGRLLYVRGGASDCLAEGDEDFDPKTYLKSKMACTCNLGRP